MRQQESEIAALKRQLESMQIAASRARAGGAGRRQMDGSVPAEYICPITQVSFAPFAFTLWHDRLCCRQSYVCYVTAVSVYWRGLHGSEEVAHASHDGVNSGLTVWSDISVCPSSWPGMTFCAWYSMKAPATEFSSCTSRGSFP